MPDPHRSAIEALENPIGTQPLSKLVHAGDKVAILVGDRITDRVVGARDGLGHTVLNYLNECGVPDSDVTLVYACGMHPHGNADEKIGPELMRRIRYMKHQASDERALVFVGVTSRGTPVWVNRYVAEADVVLGIGEISPVMFGGFCGGGKIILPGVSGRDTIEHNHRYIMAPFISVGLVDGNFIREDMEEAAELGGLTFKLDMLVNGEEKIVRFYGGDFRQEWRAALPLAREIWMSKVPRADIHVFSPGDTRESFLGSSLYLTLDAAALAMKEDGIGIALISGVDGWAPEEAIKGDAVHDPESLRLSTEQLAVRLVRKEGNLRSISQAYSNKRVLETRRILLVSPVVSDEEARGLGFAGAVRTFEEALGRALAERGRSATVTVNLPRGIRWRQMIWRD